MDKILVNILGVIILIIPTYFLGRELVRITCRRGWHQQRSRCRPEDHNNEKKDHIAKFIFLAVVSMMLVVSINNAIFVEIPKDYKRFNRRADREEKRRVQDVYSRQTTVALNFSQKGIQRGHVSPEEYRTQLKQFLNDLFKAESWSDWEEMGEFLRKLQGDLLAYSAECYLKKVDKEQQAKCLIAENSETFIDDALEQVF